MDIITRNRLKNRDTYPIVAEKTVPYQEPTIDPDNYSSLKERVKMALGNAPEREPVSKGRKILGAVLGGLTGFTDGPEAGRTAAHNVTEAPYRQKVSDYRTNLGNLMGQLDLEREDMKLQSSLANEESQRQHLKAQMSPETQGAIEGAKYGARFGYDEKLENMRFGQDMTKLNAQLGHQSTENRLNRAQDESQFGRRLSLDSTSNEQLNNYRNKELQVRVDEKKLDRDLTASEGSKDRKSREYGYRLDNDARRYSADLSNKDKTKFTPAAYKTARQESEDETLRNLNKPKRDAITNKINIGTPDRPHNVYILKEQYDVPLSFQADWRKAQKDIQIKTKSMLDSSTFEEDEWEEVN